MTRATRYRLRYVPGVQLRASTYGGGDYAGVFGDGTWGEEASDPVPSRRYRFIPWPSGYLASPAWIYRAGDTMPQFQGHVVGEEGGIDLTGLDFAMLILTPADGPDRPSWLFSLTIDTLISLEGEHLDLLTRTWVSSDLSIPGTYRAGVVLVYESGRRLSLPADDRYLFVITPNDLIEPTGPQYRWSDARWDWALWI